MTQHTPSSRLHTRSRTQWLSALFFGKTMSSSQTLHGCAEWVAGVVAVEAVEEEEEDVAARTGTISTIITTVIVCMA